MFYNFIMKKIVFAYLHTHWDREWYREFEEFHLRLVEVFDDVLQKLENNEIPSFYFDGQTAALEDYLQIKPEKLTQIMQFIKEKRLFIGPYYCSTDSFLIDAESLIKNLQLGIKYSMDLGCRILLLTMLILSGTVNLFLKLSSILIFLMPYFGEGSGN